jgi:hypothetical protein
MKKLNLLISAELHTRFKVACALEGKDMSDVVRKLIEEYSAKVEKKKEKQ